MHECVESASEGLQGFCLGNGRGEVRQDEPMGSSRAQTQELDVHTLLDQGLFIPGEEHVTGAQEEGVRVLFLLTGLIYNVLEDLVHGDDGDTHIDGKSISIIRTIKGE